MKDLMQTSAPNMTRRTLFSATFATIALESLGRVALAQYVYDKYPKPGEKLRDDVDKSRRIVPAPAKDY